MHINALRKAGYEKTVSGAKAERPMSATGLPV